MIQDGDLVITPELTQRLTELHERLSDYKGRRQYGYLDKNTKRIVDDIVKMIASDELLRLIGTIQSEFNDHIPEADAKRSSFQILFDQFMTLAVYYVDTASDSFFLRNRSERYRNVIIVG